MRINRQVGMGTAAADAYVGPSRQIIVDTEEKNLRLQDGVTPGGVKLPNESQIAAADYRYFSSALTISATGQLADATIGQLCTITIAGNIILPPLANIPSVGNGLVLYAAVAGIHILPNGADLLQDKGVDLTDILLAQYETMIIARRTTARYHVLNRY